LIGTTGTIRWVCWGWRPGGIDDRIELGPEEVDIGTDQIEELVINPTKVCLTAAGNR